MSTTPPVKRARRSTGDNGAPTLVRRAVPVALGSPQSQDGFAHDIEYNKENIADHRHDTDDHAIEWDDDPALINDPRTEAHSPGSTAGSPSAGEKPPRTDRAAAAAAAAAAEAYTADGGYDALKSFNGQVYSGMAVGGSHVWNYEPGVWTETKIEPDLWQVDFETIKRRNKNAPVGSGAPVGTEYHWVIVAHQYVKKLDANSYSTHLVGSKYKLAHKNASSDRWSVPSVKAQRDRELELLDDAKRRVEGLPPVLATEKVKVDKQEKGQQKLDSLFSKQAVTKNDQSQAGDSDKKRKRDT